RPAASTAKSKVLDNKASNAAPKLNTRDKRTSNVQTNDIKRGDGTRGNGNNINRGNINIDNSRNVNINRGNTYVRPSHVHYSRPPYHMVVIIIIVIDLITTILIHLFIGDQYGILGAIL